MITQRFLRRRGVTAAAIGLMVVAAIMLTGAPAVADPAPTPSPSGATKAPGAVAPPVAPGSISWAVQPSSASGPDGRRSFSYDRLKPGTLVRDYVAVTNFSAMPVTFELYATDAFNNASGSLDLLPATQKPTDIGSWVSDLKKTITLAPNARANEPFTLTIPKTATPGDHAGGFIASVTVAGQDNAGTVVKVDRRLAVPLNLRVDGPLTAAVTIESVSSAYHDTVNPIGGGTVDMQYTVHNTGNIRLNLTQDVVAKGLFGLTTVGRAQAPPLTDLLPGATYTATVHLSDVFPLGPMTMHVRAVPSQPAGVPPLSSQLAAVSFSVSMWATPWLVLLILVLLIGGFFVGRWVLRIRRSRRQRALADAVEIARRQTVEQLKKKATAARAGAGSSTGGGSGQGAAGAGSSTGGGSGQGAAGAGSLAGGGSGP